MKIHIPEITRHEGKIRIAARVETATPIPNLPPEAWFEFPEEFAPYVYTGHEGFVVSLVPFAMALGEDIHIDGAISSRLAFHLKHYQQIYAACWPKRYTHIQVHPSGYTGQPDTPAGRGTAIMLSGGVDALYTLRENLPENQPIRGYQINHAIYLYNFDLRGKNQPEAYERVKANHQQLCDSYDIRLVSANHNLYRFDVNRQLVFNSAFSAGFSGLGHALSNGLKRIVISSSHQFFEPMVSNSDMRTDQSLSSERLEVVHDAIVENRSDKIADIANWPPAHKYLFVCDTNWVPGRNCGECSKCVRTQIDITIVGDLDAFELFPRLRYWMILRRMTGHREAEHITNMILRAWQHRKWRIFFLLCLVKPVSVLREWGRPK